MTEKKLKKKYDLTEDLIDIEYSSDEEEKVDNLSKNSTDASTKKVTPKVKKAKVTLSIPQDIYIDYKTWCLKHNSTMSQFLVEGFELLKKRYGE